MKLIRNTCKKIAKTFCLFLIAILLSGVISKARVNAASITWLDAFYSSGNVIMQKDGVDKVNIYYQDFALIKNEIDLLAAEVN